MKTSLLIIIVVILVLLHAYIVWCVYKRRIIRSLKIDYYDNNIISTGSSSGGGMIFKAPSSLTVVTNTDTSVGSKIDVISIIKNIGSSKEVYKGNVLAYPEYFSCSDRWIGSLPRSLFQGSCGSCWAFAISTALSSRFYIESCGVSGCQSYPQINFGSLDTVNGNLNELYKFRSVYLADAFKDIDLNKNGVITKAEWSEIIKRYYDTYNSKGTPISEKHYIAQILVYILNFQSLGSINLDSWQQVEERSEKAFKIWIQFVKSFKMIDMTTKKARALKLESDTVVKSREVISSEVTADAKTSTNSGSGSDSGGGSGNGDEELNILDLKNAWSNEPITLSAEKIISCCTKCMPLDFAGKTDSVTNISCEGSTLEDGWSMMRESGTPTAMCIGYNLDNYVDGEPIPTCKEIQGPFYSFCSGYAIDRKSKESPEEWSANMTKIINKFENDTIDPVTVPHSDQNLPWTDPQLFRFRAKNVYKINNDTQSIQREISERGPVTAGYVLRKSFQNAFGSSGMGGQRSIVDGKIKNPVGSGADALVYMYDGDPTDDIVGGHAVTIVGWGTYYHKNDDGSVLKVPYWSCLNSWGTDFGTSGFPTADDRTREPGSMKGGGYFWMVRGINNCSIEDNVYAGQPDLENISYTGIVSQFGWGLPSPSKTDVTFLEQRTESELKIGPTETLLFAPSEEGGGTYAGRTVADGMSTYYLKSMTAPSPYTLFWTDYRPIYCIGTILNDLSSLSTSDSIKVDKSTYGIITLVKKIQPNPIFVVDDEQLQLLDQISADSSKEEYLYRVYRGVNNSDVSKHEIGSQIKIVPYKNLSIPDLDKIAVKCE